AGLVGSGLSGRAVSRRSRLRSLPCGVPSRDFPPRACRFGPSSNHPARSRSPFLGARGVVCTLLGCASMQVNRRWVWLGALVVAVAIAVGVVPSLRVEERVMWLASQPGDTTAFQHPESGRSDALIALISAPFLSPIALFGLVLVFLLLVRMFQSILATIRLTEWLSSPSVGVVSI